ncbi:hypothetical protein GW891_02525 [bacterium]|nr:hypothetical protein [bacterium]
MTFWNVFFGVFSGIIAGVIINLTVVSIIKRNSQKQSIDNLKFEIDYNIKKINEFLEELNNYRNKNNADNINNYFGYFSLSKVILTTAIQMFNNGLIYKFLNHDFVEKLQNFSIDFSLGSENFMNNQIKYNQSNYSLPDIKKIVNDQITFWENKFKENRKNLEEIKNELKK